MLCSILVSIRFFFHNSAVVSEAKFVELVLYRNVPPYRWQEMECSRFENYILTPLPLGPCPNAYSPLSPQDVTDFVSVVKATPRRVNKGEQSRAAEGTCMGLP